MSTSISIQDKKVFINWFLAHYQLKKRESVWILNYLINHDSLLNNVHFIREARFCPRGMIISTQCSSEVAFRFYKDHIVTTDAEKSFHDIRLNRHEPIYIQLSFKNSHQSAEYSAVLEDNPFLPDDFFITKREKQLAKEFLNFTLFEAEKKQLMDKVDYALDHQDRKRFIHYANRLKKLNDDYDADRLFIDDQ
ncbi:ReoY family proteolytic degradation factor [Amphibacillus sp. MSJ-3]|uniref:ReoY family proteolytic degradation factor n=1 Tax=Amphibacillus sp. MSJ-3 TaxID=2841505 RepID=UPI001C0F1964|nr:ReoY family proteolytic degradation factor [Amphibacillus sp. MSJ-3]MBU5594223.1 ReoY family proteolytic degradation factor [Amphibacillus sp. MSJ-3]